MAKSTNGSRKARASSVPADVLGAVGDLVAAAQHASAPVTGKAAKELRKPGKALDAARATEAKRLGQLAKPESNKGRKQVAKRQRQAGAAPGQVRCRLARLRAQ